MMNNTITISRKDFKDTCVEAVCETTQDEDLKGTAAFVVPVMETIFARKLESKLFGEEEEEKNE